VHLCDFSEVETQWQDPALERRMRHTRTAVSLGRYLRTQSGIRVRQPLKTATLVSLDDDIRADLEAMAQVIAEELNVKQVRVSADEESLVHLSVRPNFRRLGPRFGRQVREAAAKISALDSDAIRRLRQTGSIEIPLNGVGPVAITLDDVEFRREEREGLSVANEGAVTVALDTRIDANLRKEGWARELVNRIQNLRKNAGLEVTDRIAVEYDLPDEPRKALERFADHIRRETLAVEFRQTPLSDVQPLEIDGQSCRLRVRKIAFGPVVSEE